MGLGAGGAIGVGAGGAMGLGAGAAGLGAGAAGLGAGFGAAAFGLATALRAFAFGFALALDLAFALVFLAAGFLRALFFATTRFFLRAAAVFFVFFVFLAFAFFDFFVFDFAFFAMIVLPIVSAQISVRLSVRPKAPLPCRHLPRRKRRSRTSVPPPQIPRHEACGGTAGFPELMHRTSTVHQPLSTSASGLRPPVAQSISSTVWTTGIAVPAAI
jgi:hypothetical protein